MSFLETVRQVREHLQQAGRVSLRALKREFGLDDDALEELIEELVQVQRVAAHEQSILVWAGEATAPTAPTPSPPDRDPRAYTPKHLTEKILRSKSALEGERKQVTVLFADVKGSMELAEQVDPEEWHGILDRFFQILSDGVHRFEGTVNQYTGDGIMALFGAPIAHEDHARRACYAALHLRDELRRYADELRRTRGLSFSVRMGLHSGEVVVGKIGDDLRMDYTAQGQVVNLAQRMEQSAAPDTACLSEGTARLVEGFFRLRDLGEFHIKGVTEPLRGFELQDAGPMRTRLEVSRTRGFSKFVGRADEMMTLELAFNRATEGNGQVVGVVGQAGVGKSRLCLEFLEQCRARGIRVLEAHCPSHGKTVPLLPMLELLRDSFGITAQDRDQAAREKIAGRLLLLGLASDEVLPLVFDFLGVPDPERRAPQMEPEERQRQLYSFMRRLVQARSDREPAVLLFDDIQWIDAGSDAFLDQLVEATNGTRTMLLVNFRPEYHAEWIGKPHYHQLPLSPLGPEAMEELLRELLGDDPTLASLCDLIGERTGGNPFFIEEVVLSLVESGSLEGLPGRYRLATPIERLEVPATVQSVLTARIDRLPEREKGLLQTAAVIGRELPEPILEAVAELSKGELADALASLKAADFIHERSLYPEGEYVFKHPLTQEVAYSSQLGERRARIHEGVARAIEERFPEKLDERAALIGSHWDRAGRAREAAEWHRRAALWVRMKNAPESLRHWSRVRELLGQVPESPDAIALGLEARSSMLFDSARMGVSGEEISTLLAEGRELGSRCADPEAVVMFLALASASMWGLGRLNESASLAEEARALSDQIGEGLAPIYSRSTQALTYRALGRVEEALAAADEVIELSRESTHDAGSFGVPALAVALAVALIAKASTLTQMGRLREARRVLEQGVEHALEHNDLVTTYLGNEVGVELAVTIGDSVLALAHGRRSVEASERLGSRAGHSLSHLALGRAHVAGGRWEEALAALAEALAVPREYGTLLWAEPEILSQMAVAHAGLDDEARARELADQAVPLARERLAKPGECKAELVRARVLLQFDPANAREEIVLALEAASALAEEMNAKSFEPFICEERARLARVSGDLAAFERELHEAHRLYTEMGATGHAERLARELGL